MFNNIGPMGLIIILIVVLLMFGRGKIPQLMGDVAKGIKSFKKGMKDDLDDDDDDDDAQKGKIERSRDEPIDVTPNKEKNKA